jgi:hypothetical protein
MPGAGDGKKLIRLVVWLALLGGVWAPPAPAGESGHVSCNASGCGYRENLLIGSGRNSPAVTGYCPQCRDFKRVNLADWGEYRQEHHCPACGKPLQPIFTGEAVAQIPCPRCHQKTLGYQRKKRFD